MRIGAALRAVRVRRRWHQSDVAARAGVSRATVSLAERGHLGRMPLETIRRVAQVLDVRLDLVARWRGGELHRLLSARHSALHESVAVYLAFSEALLVMEQLGIRVTDKGYTVVDDEAKTIRCAMAWKDLPAFEQLLAQRLTGHSPER